MNARLQSLNEALSHKGPILVESVEREHGTPYSLSLWMHAAGPPRVAAAAAGNTAQQLPPAIIICHGMGSFSSEWAPIIKGIIQTRPATARVYVYDRAGVGGSSNSNSIKADLAQLPPRTAQTSARELHALLQAAGIPPPYLLVGHSFGGVVIREFLELLRLRGAGWEAAVHGILFVDHAVSFADLPPSFDNLVGNNADYAEVVGITVGGKPARGFDQAQWATVCADARRSTHGITAEDNTARDSWAALKRLDAAQLEARPEPLLGNRRVSVIHADSTRDFEAVYAHAVQHGSGSAADRQALRDTIDRGWKQDDERLQRRLLNLSTASRWVHVPEYGHFVHLVAPELVVQEVKWVLGL